MLGRVHESLGDFIPEGKQISNIPDCQTIDSEYGQYSIKFSKQNDKLRVVKNFLLKSGYYHKREYIEFYDFILKVNKIENNAYFIAVNQK